MWPHTHQVNLLSLINLYYDQGGRSVGERPHWKCPHIAPSTRQEWPFTLTCFCICCAVFSAVATSKLDFRTFSSAVASCVRSFSTISKASLRCVRSRASVSSMAAWDCFSGTYFSRYRILNWLSTAAFSSVACRKKQTGGFAC